MIPDSPPVQPAAAALSAALTFSAPADLVLHDFFRHPPRLGPRERDFVAEVVFGVLRHLRSLESALGSRAPRMLVLAWLVREQGWSVRRMDAFTRETERGTLARVRAWDAGSAPLAVRAEFPDWLAERLLAVSSEAEVLAIGRACQQAAPMDLRVNLLAASRDQVLAELVASGFDARPTPLSPAGIRVEGRPSIHKHPLFRAGAVEVQDEGSQLVSLLLAPRRGEMVADFCAGAGGKTLALGALMRSTGRLYAFDVSPARIARFKPRLARSGLSNVHPQLITGESDTKLKRLAGKFDRVLVDAPCSGTGTLRRNPDLKWRQSPASIAELAAKQLRILESAARLVKPGGRLVYATCSLLPEENDAVAERFLGVHPSFSLVPANEVLSAQRIPLDTGQHLRLRPDIHDTDGFFAAVLDRS